MAVRWLEKVLKPDTEAIAAAMGRLEKFLAPPSDRAERRRVEQFASYRWNGSTLTQDAVRDISSSGLFVVTRESWRPGTVVALTLQREGPLDLDPARRVTTLAKVVRCGAEGVGLSFLWSKDDPESQRWDSLLESLFEQTRPADMLSLARIVEAFAFLGQISSDGGVEIGEWVRTRASSHKILNAVSIALKAENLLGRGAKDRVNPKVALQVLEAGSGTDEDWLHRFWAGLLIASGSPDGRDQSKLQFIELFSLLTSIPIRIFTVVCTRANKVISQAGAVSAEPLACDLQELTATVGSRGSQIERDIDSLVRLQLIEKSAASGPALLAVSHTYVAPTALGLQLFALCNGHQGSVRDFYFATPVEIPVNPNSVPPPNFAAYHRQARS